MDTIAEIRAPFFASFYYGARQTYYLTQNVAVGLYQFLGNAFMGTWRDPELLAEAKRMGLEIGPITGGELQAILARIYASSEEIKRKTRDAIKVKP